MKTSEVHVAVGVVLDRQGRVLIAKRPDHLHQGGLWEFPGGKVYEGETVEQALKRELLEEVGIETGGTSKLIQIEYDYGDKQVLLDVFKVMDFSGEAHGRENQPVKWVTRDELGDYSFPLANRGIIKAVMLPNQYMITDQYQTLAEYDVLLDKVTGKNISLIQFRARHLVESEYLNYANFLIDKHQHGSVQILLNTQLNTFKKTQAAGLHLSSKALFEFESRPVRIDKLLSASVHSKQELVRAMQLEVDFVVLSPIQKTTSHPDAKPLGWDNFENIARKANCPVYALGGLSFGDLEKSICHGAQGVAGIGMFKDM